MVDLVLQVGYAFGKRRERAGQADSQLVLTERRQAVEGPGVAAHESSERVCGKWQPPQLHSGLQVGQQCCPPRPGWGVLQERQQVDARHPLVDRVEPVEPLTAFHRDRQPRGERRLAGGGLSPQSIEGVEILVAAFAEMPGMHESQNLLAAGQGEHARLTARPQQVGDGDAERAKDLVLAGLRAWIGSLRRDARAGARHPDTRAGPAPGDPCPLQLPERQGAGVGRVDVLHLQVHRPGRGVHVHSGEPQPLLDRTLLDTYRLGLGVRDQFTHSLDCPVALLDHVVVEAVAHEGGGDRVKPAGPRGDAPQLDSVE